WAGVWTNSVCGHPAPGESHQAAVKRRASFELGAELTDLHTAVPDFRYRAVDASGIVENEVCPVYTATIASDVNPHPDEVAEWQWVSLEKVVDAVNAAPFAFSPWMGLQLPLVNDQLVAAATVARRSSDTPCAPRFAPTTC